MKKSSQSINERRRSVKERWEGEELPELPVNVGSNVIKTVNICKNRTANGIVQSNGGGGVECK